jgi:hypothetical protein
MLIRHQGFHLQHAQIGVLHMACLQGCEECWLGLVHDKISKRCQPHIFPIQPCKLHPLDIDYKKIQTSVSRLDWDYHLFCCERNLSLHGQILAAARMAAGAPVTAAGTGFGVRLLAGVHMRAQLVSAAAMYIRARVLCTLDVHVVPL